MQIGNARVARTQRRRSINTRARARARERERERERENRGGRPRRRCDLQFRVSRSSRALARSFGRSTARGDERTGEDEGEGRSRRGWREKNEGERGKGRYNENRDHLRLTTRAQRISKRDGVRLFLHFISALKMPLRGSS